MNSDTCVICGADVSDLGRHVCVPCEHNIFGPDTVRQTYKTYALTAASELCYPDSVLKLIENAATDNDIVKILIRARNGEFGELACGSVSRKTRKEKK